MDGRFDYGYDGGIFNDTTLTGDDVDHDVEVFIALCVLGRQHYFVQLSTPGPTS